MNSPVPSPGVPPASPAASTPASKRRSCLLYGCGGLLALLLVIGATVAITVWWIQRPIKPVVLSASEKAVVEEKLRSLGAGDASAAARAPDRVPDAEANAPRVARKDTESKGEPDRPYVPGSKVLKLTERELNGLLNANTDLGKSVRIELGRDAINAYVAVPIPEDFPVGGGKMFRARGRFRLSLGNVGAPYAILEDVTVFGLRLPKAWLAGLKGENLLGQAVGERNGAPIIRGIKSLRVEPGALVLEVED
jgi:hypothetical protein